MTLAFAGGVLAGLAEAAGAGFPFIATAAATAVGVVLTLAPEPLLAATWRARVGFFDGLPPFAFVRTVWRDDFLVCAALDGALLRALPRVAAPLAVVLAFRGAGGFAAAFRAGFAKALTLRPVLVAADLLFRPLEEAAVERRVAPLVWRVLLTCDLMADPVPATIRRTS